MEAQIFESDKYTYVYNDKLIGIQQAQIAEEVLRFKLDQKERNAETWEAVEKSGGVEWFIQISAAILTRVENDKPLDFTAVSWTLAKDFVRKLNYKEQKRLRECMNDFFLNTELSSLYSQISESKSTKRSEQILTSLVAETVRQRLGEMPLSNVPKH